MTGFTLDPDTFGPIGQQLRGAAEDLQSAWAPVKQQTASVKFGRGDDALSPLIQAALEVIGEVVDACVQSSVESLGSYADGLDTMAQLFNGTETDTTTMFKAE